VKDNIKTDFKEIRWRVVECINVIPDKDQHGNEPSRCVRTGAFIHYLSNYQRPKKVSAP
jgi:hypothetical protein